MRNWNKKRAKEPEDMKTLRETLQEYEGRIVRIGTEASGYMVCGEWNNSLWEDMERLEEYRKEQKRVLLESMKEELPRVRKAFPKLSKEADKTAELLKRTEENRDAVLADIIQELETLERRRNRIPTADTYLQKKKQENEKQLESIQGFRKKAAARREYDTWQRHRLRKYQQACGKYFAYIGKQMRELNDASAELEAELKEIKDKATKAQRAYGLAKGKLETYPTKIRSTEKYLANYTAFIDRPVVDLYASDIKPGETSIIIRGGEAGIFWDVEEFDRWRTTGRFPNNND